MSVPVGGLRARLIRESLFNMLDDGLVDLGWKDTGRGHRPINFRSEPVDAATEIPLNTMVLSDEDVREEEDELGSNMVELVWTFYVDIYAESNAVGLHVQRDVRDILTGRMASIGRTDPSFDVFDYRDATPTTMFTCHINDVIGDRAHDFPKPWQRNWYAVRFEVEDHYASESG